MSGLVTGWVLKHSPVEKHGHLLVLITLAECAHDDGCGAYPSVETIAERSRQSRRNVQYALRELEANGHIREIGKTRRGTRVWQVKMFNPADPRAAEQAEKRSERPGQRDPIGGVSRETGGATIAPQPTGPTDDRGATIAPPGAQPPAPQGAQLVAPEPSVEPPAEPPDPSQDGTVPKDASGATPALDFRRPDRSTITRPDPQATEAWQRTVDQLRADTPDFKFHIWMADLDLGAVNGTTIYVTAPDHIRTWVRDRYLPKINAAAAAGFDRPVTVKLVAPDDVDQLVQAPGPASWHAETDPGASTLPPGDDI